MIFVKLVVLIMLIVNTLAFTGSKRWAGRMLARSATSVKGEIGTESFRVFFDEAGKKISPWHDIPLRADGGMFNFVNEIPKNTKAKMEVATNEEGNPIAQDMKKGKLRDYHGPIFWNYGCLPQTWEDPTVEHPELKVSGRDEGKSGH